MSVLPTDKVASAHKMATEWKSGNLSVGVVDPALLSFTFPGRPDRPELVHPKDVKRRRLGSIEGRFSLMHAIAHIEFNAINLAADMLVRFANDARIDDSERSKFISDWVGVCDDEARHFTMIEDRLNQLGGTYGDLPAHDGLWDAAISTANDLAARLVIAPMVLEARGLDVTPNMIEKLTKAGDNKSAKILSTIYNEEIAHVAAGSRWFGYICKSEKRNSVEYFKMLLNAHFKGTLKPPFNIAARDSAGLLQAFYDPELAVH